MAPSERGAPADGAQLTHLDEQGRPRMVDIVEKEATQRTAVAQGHIRMSLETLTKSHAPRVLRSVCAETC